MRQQINDEQRLALFQEALKLAGKFVREHPPSAFSSEVPVELLVGGSKRDPEGMEFANYFLRQAVTNLGLEDLL